MAGIKIINILKDDSFPDILELFRATDAQEVIFVLPKNSKVFRSEDHFAAFAAEAGTGEKAISILCNTPQAAAWARQYGFTVMSSSVPTRAPKKPTKKAVKAVLASMPPPADPDIREESEDAYQDDVVVPADERMNISGTDETEDDEKKGEPKEEEEIANITAATADLDYIDTVWREKAAAQSELSSAPLMAPGGRRMRLSKTGISKTIMVSMLMGSLTVLGGAVYMTTGSAKAIITPISHPVDTQLTIQVSDTFSSVDSSFNKLPGQLFSVSKSATQEATASGQRDVASKARGTVIISNALPSPQTLIATTRFASTDGFIFHTLQTVTVPASGKIKVQVIADKPGKEYNIAAGTFTIPAFKERGDMDRYSKVTATSTEAFSGGANGPSAVVTQEDYDKALAGATQTVKHDIADAFSQQENGMMILDTIAPEIAAATSTAKPDDAAANFSVTVSGSVKTVAFRRADLEALITQSLLKKERLTVDPKTLTLSYGDTSFASDTGILSFTVSVKGTGWTPIDEQAVLGAIRGMNSAQVHDYFTRADGVASALVSLSPFWVRAVPKTADRIHLQISHENPRP